MLDVDALVTPMAVLGGGRSTGGETSGSPNTLSAKAYTMGQLFKDASRPP